MITITFDYIHNDIYSCVIKVSDTIIKSYFVKGDEIDKYREAFDVLFRYDMDVWIDQNID